MTKIKPKYILGWIIRILHTFLYPVILYLIITSKNITIPILSIIALVLLIYQWYFLKTCILVNIEAALLDEKIVKHDNGNSSSFHQQMFIKVFGKNIAWGITSLTPLVIILFSFYKIIIRCKCLK